MDLKNKRIIISKTNQIGDVTFSLPMASALKKLEPSCQVIFLAREYTRALIEKYSDVDEFADYESLVKGGMDSLVKGFKELRADIFIHVIHEPTISKAAKMAEIPIRIGTCRRLINWFTCNRFVNIYRRYSRLHETQLDMHFLRPLGGKSLYSLKEIVELQHYKPLQQKGSISTLLNTNKFNLILHPKTRGEHIEWPPEHFARLIQLLPPETFQIFVTGNAKEGDQVRASMLTPFPHVVDLCGKLSFNELLHFIAGADGMICASTGPVHLAANFGINTLGLYAPIRPLDAGRWGPVGPKAEVLALKKNCSACRKVKKCHCIAEITVDQVYAVVSRWEGSRR